MTITTTKNNGCLTLELEGRLDTTTAPESETVIESGLEGVGRLVLDMEGLAYLSSAGLRVILAAQRQMNRQGTMMVRNVCGTIMEVFEVMRFTDILTIEREKREWEKGNEKQGPLYRQNIPVHVGTRHHFLRRMDAQ